MHHTINNDCPFGFTSNNVQVIWFLFLSCGQAQGRIKSSRGSYNLKRLVFIGGLFTILIIISSCFAHGLTITADMQYDYALASQKEGAHETAMVEWKRFIHFFPLDSRIPTARFNLGISLFHLKKWDQARTIFQAQRFPYVGTYQNIESFFMLSKTLLAQGRIQGARRVLVDLLSASEVTEVKDRVLCALAWISLHRAGDMEPGALEQADAFLSQISGTGEAVFHTGEIRQAVKAIVNQEEKSPFVAGITALVPGGGFLYCQRYQDALAAFIINAGLIFAAHQSFDRGDNILGGLLSVVESGFYGGSIYGSISSAHKYNRFKTRKTLHRIQHLEPLDILYINQDGALKKPENRAMLFSIQIPF